MKPKTIAIIVGVSVMVFIIFIVFSNNKKDSTEVQTATAPATIVCDFSTVSETKITFKETDSTEQEDTTQPIIIHKTESEPTEPPTVYTTKQKELDEAIESIYITIDGTELNIPSSVSDIENTGFKLTSEYKKKKLEFCQVDNPCVYKDGKSTKDFFIIHLKNTDTKTLSYSKCEVLGVEFDVNFLEKTDVVFSNLGEIKSLTLEKLEEVMGISPSKNIIGDVVICNYSPDDFGNKVCVFTFVQDKISRIEIQKNN